MQRYEMFKLIPGAISLRKYLLDIQGMCVCVYKKYQRSSVIVLGDLHFWGLSFLKNEEEICRGFRRSVSLRS